MDPASWGLVQWSQFAGTVASDIGAIGFAAHPTDIQKKRPRGFTLIGPDPKRLKLSDLTKPKAVHSMALRRRRFRGRKRRGKRRFRGKRRGFARKVRNVIRRTLEPQRTPSTAQTLSLAEGDGTTRVIYVLAPVTSLIQGTDDATFRGNKVYLKGVSLRGQLSMDVTTPPASSAAIRLTLLWSKDQGSGFNSTFQTFGNTTTSITNPTQVPPNSNPQFFGLTAVPFTGQGYTVPFDTTRHKVIKSFILPVNATGEFDAPALAMPTMFKCYVRLNKTLQMEDLFSTPLSSVPRRFKNGTYWWVLQCIAGNTGTSTDTVVNMTYQSVVYFRDV